jgi:hypothetical protein
MKGMLVLALRGLVQGADHDGQVVLAILDTSMEHWHDHGVEDSH